MAIRYLKILLTIFISLFGFFYATQNMVNLDVVFAVISDVASMHERPYYPNAFGPAVTSPALIYFIITVIIACEYSVGFLAAKGAFDMWKTKGAKGDVFNKAKKFAILGGGMAMVVWYGFFTVIGGAYFQFWQSTLGDLSLTGATQYVLTTGLVTMFIYMKDE